MSCVEWDGARTTAGYGVVRVDGVPCYVHRLTWQRHYGPIPTGMVVLHSCDNPGCINIDHLSVGTQADNVRDMVRKGRGRGCAGIGEHNSNCRLSDADVYSVHLAIEAGETRAAVARRFGVSSSLIGLIATGKHRAGAR